MVAQEHDVLVAEVGDEPLLLLVVERDALVVVIGEARDRDHRVLADRQQAVLLRGHGDAGVGVEVHDEMRIVARLVDRRMDGEAGRIDEVGRVLEDRAIEVDLDQ